MILNVNWKELLYFFIYVYFFLNRAIFAHYLNSVSMENKVTVFVTLSILFPMFAAVSTYFCIGTDGMLGCCHGYKWSPAQNICIRTMEKRFKCTIKHYLHIDITMQLRDGKVYLNFINYLYNVVYKRKFKDFKRGNIN